MVVLNLERTPHDPAPKVPARAPDGIGTKSSSSW
jgi:hypothetical protein